MTEEEAKQILYALSNYQRPINLRSTTRVIVARPSEEWRPIHLITLMLSTGDDLLSPLERSALVSG